MRMKRWAAVLAALLVAVSGLSACGRTAGNEPAATGESRAEEPAEADTPAGTPDDTTGEETQPGGGLSEESTSEAGESSDAEIGEWETGFGETGEETREPERETDPDDPETFVQKKIVVATDLHYLAEKLAGNRCQSFVSMTEKGDGRVLQYSWEILDAFIDDMLEEKPDLVVLSGDLTLDGEKASHEELAERLETLLDNGIEVAVLPGNHDINSRSAKKYTSDGVEKVESVTADEFRQIYSDFGYVAADQSDPASLSYLYKLDDYYWLLMLDSCQYDPRNLVGGMIRNETYDWMEDVLDGSWEQGAQVITVSHHNLLDQSGVSREFYDDCTIEHNEQLIGLLADYDVRLHLSGHLHLQHHMQDEDSGICEVVTGSLVMAPCRYGVLKIWNDGTLQYDAQSVDVDGWAKRNSYRNPALADFKDYSEHFLGQVAYNNATRDLRRHILDRKVFFSDQKIDEMARFYAELCIYYYGGRMYEIEDQVEKEKAYEYWSEIDYVSDLSDFLRNILEDEPKDFAHLTIPY